MSAKLQKKNFQMKSELKDSAKVMKELASINDRLESERDQLLLKCNTESKEKTDLS